MSIATLDKFKINGRDAEAEATRLHNLKNKPFRPEQETIEFPPYTFQPFPAALYHIAADGSMETRNVGVVDMHYDGEQHRWLTEEVARNRNEHQKRELLETGWAEAPGKAGEAKLLYERKLTAIPAAERAYDDQHMSEKAHAEVAAIEDASDDHVVDVAQAREATKETRERAQKTKG